MLSDHITQMGFRLEYSDDIKTVRPLLEACGLEPFMSDDLEDWTQSRYLLACTRAGGVAACVGWTIHSDNQAIMHSLGVAPPTRGSGIGGGLLATAMAMLVEQHGVNAFWLTTSSGNARHLFWSLGFASLDSADVPEFVAEHPIFADLPRGSRMARIYDATLLQRGLDNTAFRLIKNDTVEATLPLGSVFYFKQTSQVVEASYKGGLVVRGHLMGFVASGNIPFCWHQFVLPGYDSAQAGHVGRLMSGDGQISIEMMPDGRRELRERFDGSGELLLREV